MKIAKKIVAICLVLILVVTCMPLTVYADNKDEVTRYSVLVLDVSDEVRFTEWYQTIYVANSAIDYIKDSAISFLNSLLNADGKNYVSVVTYDDEEHIVSDFTDDINNISGKVQSLTHGEGSNNMNSGLKAAKSLLEKVNDENAIKNVILVTTGVTGYGDYKDVGHYDDTVIESYWNVDGINLYKFANSAYETAEQLKKISTVYTLGLFQTMEGLAEQGKNIAQFFKIVTSDIATSSDTFFEIDDPNNIGFYFGEVKEDIINSKKEDEYIQEHIKFINEKAEYLKNFGYSDIFTQTNKIALLDEEVLNYKIISALKDTMDGKMTEALSSGDVYNSNLTNNQLIAQTLITELMFSSELNDYLTVASDIAENEASEELLELVYRNPEWFKLSAMDTQILKSLIETEDKENDDYINKRDDFLDRVDGKENFIGTILDAVDALQVNHANELGAGLDILTNLVDNVNGIFTYYQNIHSYNEMYSSFIKALDIFQKQLSLQAYYNYTDPLSARNAAFAEELMFYIESLKPDFQKQFSTYVADKTVDFIKNSSHRMYAEAIKVCISEALKVICPEGLIIYIVCDAVLHLGVDLWENFSDIDETAFERELVLDYGVAYKAMADAFGTDKDSTFSDLVMTNKDMESVYVYDQGLLMFKKIATLYKNHAIKYYHYLFTNADKYIRMSDTIVEQSPDKQEWLDDDDIKEQVFVNQELLKVNYLSLMSIQCHETDYVPPKNEDNIKLYYIACPVDITVSNENGIIVQTIQNTIKKSIDDPNVNISIIKNEDGTDYTKILTVPYDYDVAILGYADGNMKIEKMVMKDGIITDTAQFENIPVSNDVHYREVIENNKLVSIEGLNKFDEVVYTTNITDSSNDDPSVEPTESSMESSIEPSIEPSAETSIQTSEIDVPKTGNDNPSILLIVLLIISSGLFCCVIKKSKSDT